MLGKTSEPAVCRAVQLSFATCNPDHPGANRQKSAILSVISLPDSPQPGKLCVSGCAVLIGKMLPGGLPVSSRVVLGVIDYAQRTRLPFHVPAV